MTGAQEEDRQYRRGVVLGLTMAEIMLLLIFLLLLILAAKLVDDRREIARLVHENEKKETALAPFRGMDPENFKIFEEYQLVKKEKQKLEQEVAQNRPVLSVFEEIKAKYPDVTPQGIQKLAELGRQTEDLLADFPTAAGQEESMELLAEAARIGREAMQDPAGETTLNACIAERDTCMAANENLSNLVAKNGGTLPSCWRDELTQDIQYIFTAYLRPDGILLEDTKIEGRDRTTLPLGSLSSGTVYSRQEFVNAGQAIYDWSDRQDPACRFYVRAIDKTGSDKDLYVALKEKGVEQIFFVLKTGGQ